LRQGVIGSDDIRVIAIGAGRFGFYVSEFPLPAILSAVFPLGNYVVSLDTKSGKVTGSEFLPSFEIARSSGAISRDAFLDEKFAAISGIIWSRVGIGSMSHKERSLTMVHNPLAVVAMPQSWGVWDKEFVASERNGRWTISNILAPPQA
jgi:hypothetical protein